MKEVNAEGVKFIYDKDFSYNKLPNVAIDNDALQFVSKEDLTKICRPTLWPNVIKDRIYVQYRFWYKETNLSEIDRKVASGLYSDADFEYSINTVFMPRLQCFTCKYEHKGLVVNRFTYPMKYAFIRKKALELMDMGKGLSCPNCGAAFNLLTVHLF